MMKRHRLVLIVLIFVLSVAIILGEKMEKKKNLLKLDLEFSKEAKNDGLEKAFLKRINNDGIILPLDGYPVYGIKKIKEAFLKIKSNIKVINIEWKPKKVYISPTNTLAYTIGKYKKSELSSNKTTEGYYASIWIKNNNDWKLAFSQGLFHFKINNKKPLFKSENTISPPNKALINSELNFANHSARNGIASAFYNYIAENGIAVGPTGPSVSKKFYKNLLKKKNNSKTKLEWKPSFSYLDLSAQIGYNTGPYTQIRVDSKGQKQILKGYFFTIWIIEKGKWKFIYDGGNSISENK